MREDIKQCMSRIKEACYEMSLIAPYERFRLTYDKNKRINDKGKLSLEIIHHYFSS